MQPLHYLLVFGVLNNTKIMKMKNVLFICLAVLTVFSCDDIDNLDRIEGMGPIVESTIEVDNFTGIALDAPFTVELTQGDEISILAKGHQNIIDRLRTDVKSDKVNIKLENGNYKDFELTLYVTMPELNYLSIDGSGKFKVDAFVVEEIRCHIDGAGDLEFKSTLTVTEDFRIDIDGAGDTYIQELMADNAIVHVDGNGDITLRGKATSLEVNIDGMGDVSAFALECKKVEVHVDGLGKTEVQASEELEVEIDGIGNVYYKGDPTISKDIDGIGRLYDAN